MGGYMAGQQVFSSLQTGPRDSVQLFEMMQRKAVTEIGQLLDSLDAGQLDVLAAAHLGDHEFSIDEHVHLLGGAAFLDDLRVGLDGELLGHAANPLEHLV